MNYNKTKITKAEVDQLCSTYRIPEALSARYGIPKDTAFNLAQILSSILIRRKVTEGKDILYYLEQDLRFQHSPFLFTYMEDAVTRILQAKDEGEKVLIFGDNDVDGITSTAILYSCLKEMGLEVQWKLPLADDPYGLNIKAVDDFYNDGGSLIITVDCGISNFDEIHHANQLQIDVIVTDHHNPPEKFPEAILVLDPKTEDSGYPFHDISGAAVAFKLVSALRFSETDFYGSEICLMDVTPDKENNCFYIDCVKIKNLVRTKYYHEKVAYGTSIYNSKLLTFLQGQLLYAWNAKRTKQYLAEIFGNGVEYNIIDFGSEISKIMPSLKNKELSDAVNMSAIGKYLDEEKTAVNTFYNIYVTYAKTLIASKYKTQAQKEKQDLQLVGLAALADIMPMKNENRLFVKNGLASLKKDGPAKGLAELFAKLGVNSQNIASSDLSWTIIPALNAAGRLGQADVALKLLLSEDGKEREKLADKIYQLNEERKNLVSNAIYLVQNDAEKSVQKNDNKLCVVVNEAINKGVTGIFAARLMQQFEVPAIAVTFSDDICIGSMRSCRNFVATDFLDSFGDFFLNHGGHDAAAGFSFERSKLDLFLKKIKDAVPSITLADKVPVVNIDAEIPVENLTPEAFNLLDAFEPYGAENPELLFVTRNFHLHDATIVGKKDPMHLKMIFDTPRYKFPAMYWEKAKLLNNDIIQNNNYDIMYVLTKSYFNGLETKQLTIKNMSKPE